MVTPRVAVDRRRLEGKEARDREMYRRYSAEGWTLREIADEWGLHPGTVLRVFQGWGWPRRRRGPQEGDGRMRDAGG